MINSQHFTARNNMIKLLVILAKSTTGRLHLYGTLYFRGLFIDKFGFHFSGIKVDMKLDGGQEESLGTALRPATDTMSIFKVQITPHYH